jgi:hypothetical protein
MVDDRFTRWRAAALDEIERRRFVACGGVNPFELLISRLDKMAERLREPPDYDLFACSFRMIRVRCTSTVRALISPGFGTLRSSPPIDELPAQCTAWAIPLRGRIAA